MIQKKHVGVIILFICCLFCFSIEAAQQKIVVIVDDSSIKDTPNIRGKTLVKVALNTVFNAEGIQGEWYKVTMQNEGVEISGSGKQRKKLLRRLRQGLNRIKRVLGKEKRWKRL